MSPRESWGDQTGLLQLTQHLAVSLESKFSLNKKYEQLKVKNVQGNVSHFFVERVKSAKRERNDRKWLEAKRYKEVP